MTLDEENKTLGQEVEEQKARALRMEGALAYVEEQVAELWASQSAQPPPRRLQMARP